MLQGALTAMITPFRDGEVDQARLAENVAFQIERGIDGLVPTGTTGESPTLSHHEHRLVVEKVVEAAAGRTKVVAGTGSNATSEALELTEHARSVGADAALMVNPYYNKPTQEGMYRHFMTVADQVDLPIVLYNIPGRTGVALTPQTIARLATHPNIVGVKEATGSMDTASEIAALCGVDDFDILSGDDSLTLPLMAIGGKGVISVVSNLLPDKVKAITDPALRNDFNEARAAHLALFPLLKACLSLATNPIPIKTAMAIAGRDTGDLRLPLCEMDDTARQSMEQTLRDVGALETARS
jgi:4-hydroxy-tetrahydrodipicolinate synthase